MHPDYERRHIGMLLGWAFAVIKKGYKRKRIIKDWAYAEHVTLQSPELLEYCKELNPEFAQRYLERLEREKIQDSLVEQTAQGMRAEWSKQQKPVDDTESLSGNANSELLLERAREQAIQRYVEEELKD
jgi:hypothetical protein